MMSTRRSRPIVVGLLGALFLALYACAGTPAPSASIFVADAGSDTTMTVVISPDDGPGSDAPLINLGSDAPTQDALVDACGNGVCSDVLTGGYCGDGIIEAGEACDDGNSVPGDGCSGICQIEPGYTCPTAGLPCIYTVPVKCGDGIIEGNEACDDGNVADGDGCSSMCQVEPGWSCSVPGMPCTKNPTPRCGDGAVNNGEQCDDGNTSSGDGCSATCMLEQGWTCPKPGSPCVALQYCGDGIVQTGEQCDDGNAVPGDGCSGVCKVEPGYACPMAGKPCVRIWVCGNGKIDPGEACDDGNTASGDGCSSGCTVEPGFTCPNVNGNGGPCVRVPPNTCGDGILTGTEQCDDGNTNSGDGCSSTCQVEPGFNCPTPGAACKKIEVCGDGVVNIDLTPPEQCDDGNTVSGDGCTSLCQLEPNFVCPTPGGQPCVSTVRCGDGKIAGSETCDDGNAVSGDGCSSSCHVETGWQCPTPAFRCISICGDGLLVGTEQCDDGNTVANDGCSPTCSVEPGFACAPSTTPPPATVCHKTTCGDGIKEGSEQCDDGNLIPYDGCSPTCTIDPVCNGTGGCTGVCGDGLVFPGEACDDGNTVSGDGCSSTCQLETNTGWSCANAPQPPAATLAIPILYRDMLYWNTTGADGGLSNGHPDFNRDAYNTGTIPRTGLVSPLLGADSKPIFQSVRGTDPNQPPILTDATSFCWWYHESGCGGGGTNPFDKLVFKDLNGNPTTLTLAQAASGTYTFNNQSFFPLDGLGWNAGAGAAAQTSIDCSLIGADGGANPTPAPRNFSFTSELHYIFTFQAAIAQATPAQFNFTGDDDVWAFINNRIFADLGGMHDALSKSIVLDPATAAGFGLADGGWYSIDLFQAERHTCRSTYALTLSNFVHVVTQCHTVCGDNIVAGNEQCDEGALNGTGYGHCTSACTPGPRCGDAVVQNPPEQCDDGVNLTTYGGFSKVCGPGCKFAPYCGDGLVSNGEDCDEGALNGSGYGHCTSACKLGPRCGDGLLQTPQEQCDDGTSNGSTGDKCNANCTLKCGDGVLEPGEQCDNGAANNTGGYGGCNADCTRGPYCGDGIKNGTEQCDDGKNDGSYGTCKPNCTLGPYCGDGIVQNPPEQCDQGAANSASAYGTNLCTNYCTPAPFCGDKQVQGQFGETCDDGVNSGQPGSCTPDCKAFVPLPTCGNGRIDAPEQCDDGANNGKAGDKCDVHCRFTCGNGVRDPGEQCDNGVNNGAYGTCNSDCTLAPYCGDGITNGPESCDNGANNVPVATAYGPGVCTTACVFAPFCGDGRVQAQFGEQCDSSSNCSPMCLIQIAK
jgi:fibro-slime domain-containing protein